MNEFAKYIKEYDPEKLADSNSKDNQSSIHEEVDKKKSLEKKDSIILMGESIEFTYKERDIDFPEHLIEETGGVKGYIRKTIEWKSIEEMIAKIIDKDELKDIFKLFVKNYPNRIDKKYVDKEIGTINSMQDFHFLKDFCDSFTLKSEYGGFNKEFDFRKVMKIARFSEEMLNIETKIINKLGDNFISKTNIHQMNRNSYIPNDEESFEKKMLLQRIFDPGLCLSESLESENHDDFMNRKYQSFSGEYFNIFSVKDLKIVDDKKSYEIFKKFGNNSRNLLLYLKDNSMFLEPIVGNYSFNGLSVSNEGFWGGGGDSNNYTGTRSFLGFSNDNKAYLKYLNSCNELYKKLLEANINNDDFKDQDYNVVKDFKYRGIKTQMNYPYRNSTTNLDDLIETGKSDASINDIQSHPVIPVIINHPDIPDLRWCHSSYAYIPSKNGINIIQMKS